MSITRIPEQGIPGKRLGRHIDNRAGERRAIDGPPPLSNTLFSIRHPSSPNMPLNQGETSACTAHALTGNLNTVPHWRAGNPFLEQAQVWPLYSEEEQLLGAGPYPPNDEGGTGQYVCEAGEKLGYVSGFNYAANIHEVLLSLCLRPGIGGINWYTSFDSCDPKTGIVTIAPGATVRGGHEIDADELVVPDGITVANMLDNLDVIEVWFWQSWGPGVFGLDLSGRFGMSAATLSTLMGQGGDFKVPRTAKGWVAQPQVVS